MKLQDHSSENLCCRIRAIPGNAFLQCGDRHSLGNQSPNKMTCYATSSGDGRSHPRSLPAGSHQNGSQVRKSDQQTRNQTGTASFRLSSTATPGHSQRLLQGTAAAGHSLVLTWPWPRATTPHGRPLLGLCGIHGARTWVAVGFSGWPLFPLAPP